MPILMIVIDGMQNDFYGACTSLTNHNPILKNNTPKGMATDSLNCIMTLLGVHKNIIPKGRAYVESLALNINISQDDVVFRCNHVEVENNILISSVNNNKLKNITNDLFDFIYIENYKYLLIVHNSRQYFNTIKTFYPHQNIGKNIKDIMPIAHASLQNILTEFTQNCIMPWGQAVEEQMPSFASINNKSGAMVAKTEIAVGIAKLLHMHCPKLKNATADIDTDLHEKAIVALNLTKKYDFVMLHINGADEVSHRRDLQSKIDFIKLIDEKVINYIIKNMKNELLVIITADHETSAITGEHINSAVCYYEIQGENHAN